jgi:GNAT superfamily N-acetyltransferase
MIATEIIERDMTPSELERMNAGFNENAIDNGVIPQGDQRFGYVAMDGEKFIGCVSCLAYKNGDKFNGWCYLTDLFVEKEYRLHGIGANLLHSLERKLLQHGINKIWTWTAGYEAPKFYIKQGYEIFAEMENWYSSGDSQVGLRKMVGTKE